MERYLSKRHLEARIPSSVESDSGKYRHNRVSTMHYERTEKSAHSDKIIICLNSIN